MVSLVLGWAVLAVAALVSGRLPTFAFLILTLIALYLYVPWVRLRASGIDGSSRPVGSGPTSPCWWSRRAACLALGVMLARRTGLL